jgi:hypothetical protein
MISKYTDKTLTPDPLSHRERGAEGRVRGTFNRREAQGCHDNL